jgi:hypothetical protein
MVPMKGFRFVDYISFPFPKLLGASWVALGRYLPRAPTDPDVRTLAHPVPQPTDLPSTSGPSSYPIELR